MSEGSWSRCGACFFKNLWCLQSSARVKTQCIHDATTSLVADYGHNVHECRQILQNKLIACI